MHVSKRTQLVKETALAAGFDLVGITSAEPLLSAEEHLLEWLRLGYEGSMSYLAREPRRRAHPEIILPGAKSVIVLGLNYFPGAHETPASARFGRVAKYAYGRDYHRTLDQKTRQFLKTLALRLSEPFQAKTYTDTGPVLERALAQRAGLGFIGKNTLTIGRKHGSWIFLSVIITDLELAADQPDLRTCGTCTKCIEACPTEALLGDYRMDARKCISYWTIEERGAIAPELRSKFGDWVFGCDICQDVCPLNVQAAPHQHRELRQPEKSIRHEGLWIELEKLLALRREEDFKIRFEGSPLRRAKREGLLRNAAVTAGNSKDPALLPALFEALLNDASPLVRAHAAWALGEFSEEEAREALFNALRSELSEHVRDEIQNALLRHEKRAQEASV